MPVTIVNSKAYTHATVFNQIKYISLTTLTCLGHSKSKDWRNNQHGLLDLLGEKVIRKRKATTDDDRALKRLCVEGPPVHKRSFLVQTTLEWKLNGKTKKVPARLLLDSGCTGLVMSQSFIKKHGISLEAKRQRLNKVAANGQQIKGGTHNTKSIGVWIGKHVSDMKFESMGITDEGPWGLVGYLLMS